VKRILAWLGIVIVLALFFYFGLYSMSKSAASVAIIGGSDGPTAIFLTRSSGINWIEVVFLVIAGGGILALLKATKSNKKQDDK
jgi:Na+-transporting methylmalonyl-CoA/oxaloacetate decarboxylase beta subunit